MADDSIISYSDLIGDDGTFKQLSKDIEKLEKQLIDLAKATKKAFKTVNPNDAAQIEKLEKQVRELTQANKNLAKSKEVVAKAQKKQTELTKEELIQREALKLERREALRLAKAEATILKEEGNTIKSLRAQLSKATIEWSKFTAEELKNTKAGKEALKNKKDLTNQLKKLEKATGDNRRNVGNYTSALSGLDAAFVGLGGNIGITVGAFKSLALAVRGTARSMGVLKTAIAATGIGLLVTALGSLVALLKRTSAGVETFKAAFAAVSATVNVFLDRIATLGSAIVKLFSGDFKGAAEEAGRAISGVYDEIKTKAGEAADESKRLSELYRGETALIVENAKRRLQIAELERKAEENKKKDRKAAAAQLRRAIKLTKDIFNSELDIEKQRVKIAQAETDRFNSTDEELRELEKKKEAIILKEAQREDAVRSLTRKLNSLTQAEGDNTKALERRIKAIEKLQTEIARLEAQNTEEGIKRALALEEQRFKEEQALRIENFDKLQILVGDNEEELRRIQALNQKLSEEQLKAHEKNKTQIIEDATRDRVKQAQDLIKENEQQQRDFLKQQAANAKKQADDITENVKKQEKERAESLQRQEKATKELLSQIGETANKIGAEVVNLLEKQADLAQDNVNDQVENLDRARERAAQGLEANIAFEKKELAARQAEQQKKEKQAQQAAKILSLFNLVSAYAQSGDPNALFRGLADFAILEAVGAGLQGFYEGTEDTGTVSNALDNKGGRLAILHDNERVVTKAQNILLGGMSNEELVQNAILGSQMSDNFNPMSATKMNMFVKQKEDFIQSVGNQEKKEHNNRELINEVKALRKEISNQPNMSYELEKLYEGLYGLVKSEQRNNFKKTQRVKLRPKF